MHSTFEKYYNNLNENVKQLEDKLLKYVDSKITDLPKPPSKFETSPQVLDDLKILSLNIKNIVLQKNTLEIQSRRHDAQLENLTKQLQEMKE
jgi:hypothetical protein